MDVRDEVAQTCILIKSIPFDTDDEYISKTVGDEAPVIRVYRYTEQADNSIRFIVQLRTRQDAVRLIGANNLFLRNPDNDAVQVEVGFCPECVVPTEWIECSCSDLTEDNDANNAQCDRPGRTNNKFKGEADDTDSASSALTVIPVVSEESNSEEDDLTAKFSDLAVFSDEEEKCVTNKKDQDVDDLRLSSEDIMEKSDANERGGKADDDDDDDRVVYTRPRQEATKVRSSSTVPDVVRPSPPDYDTPPADNYEPMGDVYTPMWMIPKQRPVSLSDLVTTPRSTEKSPRSISVFVDSDKSLTEHALLGSSDLKKMQYVVESRSDPSLDSNFTSHVSMVTATAVGEEDDPEISKTTEDHRFVTDTASSEIENRVQLNDTKLDFQANDMESTDLTEIAARMETEKNRQTITGKSDSFKQTGEEVESVVSEKREDSQGRTLQTSSPSIRGDVMSKVNDGKGQGPEKMISQSSSSKHDVEEISSTVSKNTEPSKAILKNETASTQLPAGFLCVGQGPDTAPIVEVAPQTPDTRDESSPQHGQESSPVLLHPVQPPSGQLGQGQLQHAGHLGPTSPLIGQSGQGQQLASQLGQGQLFAGQLDPAQPLISNLGPTSPLIGQTSQGQPLAGQLDQGQQFSGQLDPAQLQTGEIQQPSDQSHQGQHLAGQLGQGQQLSGQLGQGQQPHTNQLGQGQQVPGQLGPTAPLNSPIGPGQLLTVQVGQGQQLSGQLGQGQHFVGQLGQGQQLYGQLSPAQQPYTNQLSQGQQVPGQLGQGQQLSGQLGQGQQLTGQLGPTHPHTGQLCPAPELVGQQFANVYHHGQHLPPPIYQYEGQTGQQFWPMYYPYQGPHGAGVHYQQHWWPGAPDTNYSMAQHVVPRGLSPHQAPHVAPQHQIVQPQNTGLLRQVAPPTATTQGVTTHPSFPASYPSTSSPEGVPPVTVATSITRPQQTAESGATAGDLVTDNQYQVPRNGGYGQEIQTGNFGTDVREITNTRTSLEMEQDDIRELEEWAQSPLQVPGSGQKRFTFRKSEDSKEEEKHLYESIRGYMVDRETEPGDFGQIKLLNGVLTELKQVDVIVNPTNKDLNLSLGNVSKSILKAAGQQIQEECTQTYPRGIKKEIVAVTSGGRLSCQKIFHVILPRWEGVADSAYQVLEMLVTRCLSMAVHMDMNSIAFPALGTGKMGYPADLVAKAMLQTAKTFLSTAQRLDFLVYFVIYHADNANRKAFENTAMSVLKSSHDEEEPMEVDDKLDHSYLSLSDVQGNHTYVNVGVLEKKAENLYDSLKFTRSGIEQNPSLPKRDDEDPYMKMDFKRPVQQLIAGQHGKDATYMSMRQVEEHDPYAFVQGDKRQGQDLQDGPIKNTETSGIRQRSTETGTVERSPKGSNPLEDLPSAPDPRPQFLRVTYPRPIGEDTIRFYFENLKKSGGGEILKLDHYHKKKVTLIQFEDPDAARRVLAKDHKLEGSKIQITMVTGEIPSDIEERKLLICDINPETTYDTLVNFLEVKAKATPTNVMYGNRKDRAVVTFDSPPDIDFLKKICLTKRLEGSLLKVSHVPVATAVLVKDCPKVSEDAIMLFFENEKRSGGGEVESVEIIPNRQECLVHFVDPAVAKRVCDPAQKLQIEKKEVTASLYYPFLRSTERSNSPVEEPSEGKSLERKQTGRLHENKYPPREHSRDRSPEQRLTRALPDPPLYTSRKSPSPVTLTDIEANLTKFIMSSDPNKSAFENMMHKVKGKVIWPENLETDLIRITCSIDMYAENMALEVKQWSTEIYRNVKKFFGAMTTEEVPVVKQIWEAVLSELQNMNISHPDGVAVILNSQHHTIVIAGHTTFVKDLKKKVEVITTRSEESLREESDQVSKSEFLKMFQIQILWKFKFREEIHKRYPNLETEIDVDNKKISFRGVLKEVDEGRFSMRKKLESLCSESVAISRGMKDLFYKIPAKTEFVKQLKQRHLVAVWDLPPHQDVCVMYAKTSQTAKDVVGIFTRVLKEKKISIRDDFEKFVSSTKWQSTLKDLFAKYPEDLQISVDDNCIYVTAVGGVFDKVCDCIDAEISDYRNIHDTHKEFLPVAEGVFSFLEKHKRYDIETCTLALQKSLNLHVKTRNSQVKPGYDMEGTRDAIKLAKKKLQDVIDQVSMDTHTVRAVGAADFFNSTDGQDKIRLIETAMLSVIRKSAEYRGDQAVRGQSSLPITKAKCDVRQGKQCIVVEGDMTKLRVDVMVNAANMDMMHGGGIAGAIAAAGGPSIQNECDDNVRKHGQVPEGQAICSGPGNLPCKMVVHTVGPTWQDGYHGEEKKLQEAVYRSLDLAHAKDYTSIALPAISAGIFGYPLRKSVQTIIDMVEHFFTKCPTTRIRNVYLCDTDHQTVELFIKELVSIYGPQKLKTSDDTDSASSDEESSEEESDDESEDVPRNIAVRVVRGELAKTKADVLVNSTGKDLVLSVGLLSNSLLQYGGPSLQTECRQRYAAGIVPGEVAMTMGGNLQCQWVYHGTFDSWGSDQAGCLKNLKKFVDACLHTADRSRMTSIAFPALGAGRLGYPPATVANLLLSRVREFEKYRPNSCLTNVMFVVYPKDKQAVQDFESAVDKDRSGGASGSSRAVSSNHGTGLMTLGQVDIEVKQGDITKATTAAIVNSTGDHLDLTRGAVSKAILKAGGPQLQVECNARRINMQSRGLVVTTGGNLMCQYILHVRSCSRSADWAQAVTTCLREADRLKCAALTFPALGTGQVGCPPKDVADTMFTAIRQLTDQFRYLRKVNIVIYQADMVDIFKTQLKRHLGGADAQMKTRPTWTKEKEAYKSKSKSKRPKSKDHRSATSSPATPDNVQFLLWSDSSANLQKAKSRIDQACDSEFRKVTLPSSYREIIKGLNQYQIADLNKLGSQRNVHVRINQTRGEITLEGRRSPTSDLLPAIQDLLHKFEKHKDEVEKAKTMADYVQWLYDDNGKWRRFIAEVNMVIEKAYKSKDVQTKVKDNRGVTYVIDFQKMEEYEKDSPTKKYKIERRDLGARTSVGIRLPSTWAPMDKDVCKLVTLSSSDADYKKTEQEFRASTGGRASSQQVGMHQFLMQGFMAPQHGQVQVIKIQRIQNKSLYQQYSAKKQELLTRNRKDPEQWLWHGTSSDTVEKIAFKGFDRSYCGKNATAYGNGVYFAKDASYSMGYCQADNKGQKYMFYTRVLTGESCAGHSGMKYLPDRPGVGARGSTAGLHTYDSATNNTSSPSMYIIFHDSQAYPAYLITFR